LPFADGLPMNAEDVRTVVDLARTADFRLGALAVHPARREVGDGATRQLLEPRVMQVLVALARRPGEVVSRDDLIASCWSGRVVGDDAINACVAKVRRVGESTGAYAIETIARVGYRLEARGEPPAISLSRDDVVLAVLAFENLSGDPDLSYFSDGLSEEILHTLARRTEIKVIGRASSFRFRGSEKASSNVAAALGATHILDGSVRRSDQRVRISTQLIECAGQTTIWADRFERELSDVLALQDEIAEATGRGLRIVLSPPVRSGAIDPDAYDLYLRANIEPPDLADAYALQVQQLEEVVERAPRFADAWASLAYRRAGRAYFLSPAEAAPLWTKAKAEAATALSLEPKSGFAAAAMARATPAYSALAEHGAWIEQAVAFAPNNPIVRRLHSRFLVGVGRCREGVASARLAHRLDPLDLYAVMALGRSLSEAGRYPEGQEVMAAARHRWREFQLLPVWMAMSLALGGNLAAAREVVAQAEIGVFGNYLAASLDSLFEPGAEAAERAIERLRRYFRRTGRVTIDLLVAAAHRGHADEAFDLTARAELGPDRGDGSSTGGSESNLSLLFIHAISGLRSDPRFIDLCKRLRLVDYWVSTGRWPDCVEEVAQYYDFKAECLRVADAQAPS
jgi:TolB-like protein